MMKFQYNGGEMIFSVSHAGSNGNLHGEKSTWGKNK